jgi:hypothetical protein
MSKIVNAGMGHPTSFVMAFMGSSVTAGHDSPFNVSFPVRIGENMAPALEAAGISVESRNAAMGNNPCLPYDVCVKAFSGADADLVHWEQSFNVRESNLLHGCMVAWLHGCMVAWLHGCMVAWLHGCMVAWLHGCMVTLTYAHMMFCEMPSTH